MREKRGKTRAKAVCAQSKRHRRPRRARGRERERERGSPSPCPPSRSIERPTDLQFLRLQRLPPHEHDPVSGLDPHHWPPVAHRLFVSMRACMPLFRRRGRGEWGGTHAIDPPNDPLTSYTHIRHAPPALPRMNRASTHAVDPTRTHTHYLAGVLDLRNAAAGGEHRRVGVVPAHVCRAS